jgi:hypothetical protein
MSNNSINNSINNSVNTPISDYAKWQDEVDMAFMLRVQKEVTQTCALPLAVPLERIPEFIRQAADYFVLNSDWCSEERMYIIKNSEFCKNNGMNKIVTLPPQIIGVHGVYRSNSQRTYGTMADFSLERMMLSSYAQFGGIGTIGGGVNGPAPGLPGYTLSDVIAAMYEVDTFNQTLNSPLTYDYNIFSHQLVILGDLKWQDVLIACYKRCTIQALYNNHYFFRYVVCLVMRALNRIYGTFEFKLPGGVTINYSTFKDEADEEIQEIKEWVNEHNGVGYFFQPNTL